MHLAPHDPAGHEQVRVATAVQHGVDERAAPGDLAGCLDRRLEAGVGEQVEDQGRSVGQGIDKLVLIEDRRAASDHRRFGLEPFDRIVRGQEQFLAVGRQGDGEHQSGVGEVSGHAVTPTHRRS